MQDAINDAIARGVPIGGTSAGLAVLGEFVFAALQDTTYSKLTLANPFDKTVTLERDYLRIPTLKGIITDTHLDTRDRMGRLLVFMARILHDGWTPTVSALAVDEAAAVAVEPCGRSTVMGGGAAYFLRASAMPEKCAPGVPLSFSEVKVFKAGAGGSAIFDLNNWTGSAGTAYVLSVRDGVVRSTQAGGGLY